MSRQLDQYRQRYIQAIRTAMAENNIELYKDIAPKIKSTHQTLSAIIAQRQYPTVQHGISLCAKYGFSANWLFLGKGKERIEDQATLDRIMKAIQKL